MVIAGLLGGAAPLNPAAQLATGAQQSPLAATNQQLADSDKRGTFDMPVVTKVIPVPEGDQQATHDHAERDEKSSADRWMVRLTGGLLFAAFIQAIILGIQAVVFWIQAGRLKATIVKMDEIAVGQASDMKASISQATAAAFALKDFALEAKRQTDQLSTQAMYMGDTLVATQKMAQGAEATANRQLRAYINVERIVAQKASNGINVVLRIRNFGRTPAYEVQSLVNIQITEYPFGHEMLALPTGREGSKDTLGPTAFQDLPLWLDNLNMRPQEQAVMNKTRAVLVRGLITYRDAFGERHNTSVRLFSNGPPWREGNFCADSQGNECD